MTAVRRPAIVLFNLGGPDHPGAVRPFLQNLFSDPAILSVPALLRRPLAWMIARRRAPIASEIYARMGGASPLLPLTQQQAQALELRLRAIWPEARVFIAMRYWHPMSDETANEVRRFGPDHIVLLPLYPQFSVTTSGSSIAAWHRAASVARMNVPTQVICCYPLARGWITAQATLIAAALRSVPKGERPRVLFSAHGLPKRIIAGGDPYQWQVERTAAAVLDALAAGGEPGSPIDHSVCYQSRVGPLEWIGPSTEAEIERAAADGVVPVLVPIAFVSEHSETLVELDVEYRERAMALGIRTYIRVAAVGTAPEFIDGLATMVTAALTRDGSTAPDSGRRLCGRNLRLCPCAVIEETCPAEDKGVS
ncbi:MAG: ferrochelatase [Rhodospirillales bacterium]|jgi:ferrochelatase|nr:ferrochelatase [Rhodospirillales bacterium]